MRLHSLTLQAFGPFAGIHTIDFESLSADGLFLLHGDTGAGARAQSSPPSALPCTASRPGTGTCCCAATTPPHICSHR